MWLPEDREAWERLAVERERAPGFPLKSPVRGFGDVGRRKAIADEQLIRFSGYAVVACCHKFDGGGHGFGDERHN